MNPSIRDSLEGPNGYLTGLRLQSAELACVKSIIEQHWLDRIRQRYPRHSDAFAQIGIDRYHELSHLMDHGAEWPKKTRILPAAAAREIREMSLLKHLEEELGAFVITDEEEVGWEEFVWRLVRPDEPSDVGPIHADEWFVVLDNEPMPPGRPVKVWIAIVCEPGRNGLCVAPGSHLRQWRYHGVVRHGKLKPQLDDDEDQPDLQLVSTAPGEAIVFHHDLIHGGQVNRGATTRVSLEFTFCVSPDE